MRPKRVLHVLKYYRPRFTGEGAFLERSTAYMQALAPGVEHELLVTNTAESQNEQVACSTLSRVHYLSRRQLTGWRHEWALVLWFFRNLSRYDVVHVRTHVDWYFLTYFMAKLWRRRLIISATLDDSVPVTTNRYRKSVRGIVQRLFGFFDCFISASPRLQEETAAVMPHRQCELIPYGINMPPPGGEDRDELRLRLGIPADALVLIFVGGLCRRKDPLFLVEQMPAILQRHAQTWLLLVGPELELDYVVDLRAAVRRLGLTDRVIFVGQVSNPHPYFQAADIMTFSSLSEGFGMVVPEAQTNGLPVVVRHLPGVNDLFVKHGETGFLFSDAATYLESVLRLADDPALRRRVGESARAFVRATFDMTEIARRYLGVYGIPLADTPAEGAQGATELRSIGNDASVVNMRFRQPVCFDPETRPMLLTVIDAEEAFDWSHRPFSRLSVDVSSMRDQARAHSIFQRHGVIPTYMVDYPVASQQDGCAPLLELLADGRCDIGAQLHTWVTPPFEEELNPRNSYAANLPVSIEYQKTRVLTETIENALGVRPRIFRSGRFGAGPRTGDILKSLGYLADSSVMPGWSFKAQGGPDFIDMPSAPYWIDADHSILEIPGTAGFVGQLSAAPSELKRLQFSGLSERLFWPALSSRLGLLERIRLTPEGVTCEEAKRLVRQLLRRGERVFALTYHSPSLKPGCTPYVRNEADLVRFLNWLDEFYDFFKQQLNGEIVTWQQVRDRAAARPLAAVDCHEHVAA